MPTVMDEAPGLRPALRVARAVVARMKSRPVVPSALMRGNNGGPQPYYHLAHHGHWLTPPTYHRLAAGWFLLSAQYCGSPRLRCHDTHHHYKSETGPQPVEFQSAW